jgi:hypothetical protein
MICILFKNKSQKKLLIFRREGEGGRGREERRKVRGEGEKKDEENDFT